MLLRKSPAKKKLALTMNMVMALELGSAHCRDPYVRAMSGYACFCAYGRLRASDAGRIKAVEDQSFIAESGLETGTLECSALATKTATTPDMKRKFLPVVVPLISLTGTSWWHNFTCARDQLGLPSLDSESGVPD